MWIPMIRRSLSAALIPDMLCPVGGKMNLEANVLSG